MNKCTDTKVSPSAEWEHGLQVPGNEVEINIRQLFNQRIPGIMEYC